VETREAARRWARIWQVSWVAHDTSAIAGLYAADAIFQSHPFREAEPVREYVERVFAEEASADPVFGEPLVEADRAVVEWRARTTLENGSEENLIGVSLLHFNAEGLVIEQRDIWCRG
jgi:SnoaL-like protein